MKKLISLFLAVLMIVATMPMALAADPIALTTANVTEWPTAEYKDGQKLYFGQKDGEVVSWTGGKVEYNGTVVPGHFELLNPDKIQTSTGKKRADIKFIPDDATAYTGFESTRSRNATYTVDKTTPVFVDKENDPLVATPIEAGSKLSASVLSGGKMVNPYYADEPNIAARSWNWDYDAIGGDIVIKESGYYTASFVPVGYEKVTEQVWVEVVGAIKETEITTIPEFSAFDFDGRTFGDLSLDGFVATEKGTDTVVEGTFSTYFTDKVIDAGTHTITVVFTPADTENYLPCEIKTTVTVNTAIPAWKDGEAVITVPYGTKIDSSFGSYVTNALEDVTDGLLRTWSYKTIDGAEITKDLVPTVGTHEVTANLNLNGTGGQNFQTDTTMTFTLVVEGTVLDCKVSYAVGGYQVVDKSLAYNAVKPTGTFTVIGKLGDKVVSENTVKYGEIFETNEVDSGTYVYTMKYNPTQNDPFVIADSTSEFKYLRPWVVTIDEANYTHKAGDIVNVKTTTITDFKGWKITDASGNAISVVLVDTSVDPVKEIGVADGFVESSNFYFLMAEGDIIFTPQYETSDDTTGGILDGIGDIDGIDGILAWLKNLIEKIKGIFETIIEFFQSIGDMT